MFKVNRLILIIMFITLGSLISSLVVPVLADGKCQADEIQISLGIGGSGVVNEGSTANPIWCVKKSQGSGNIATNPVFIWALAILKFLAAGVGIGVTAGIVYGGILYGSSQGNPGQIKKAISIIVSAVTGLVLFIMMSAIVNFIIPGGIFQ